MSMNRRDIFKFSLGAAAVAAGWQKASAAQAKALALPKTLPKGHKGTLVFAGMDGWRHADVMNATAPHTKENSKFYSRSHSVITELNPKTGDIKQTTIPIRSAHAVARLPNGNLVVTGHHRNKSALLDEGHNMLQMLHAPENFLYGGHSWHMPEKGVLVVALRHATPKSTKDTGLLHVYDDTSFKLLESYDSGGIHPHEIRVLPDREEFVVTHYGDIKGTPHPKGYSFTVREPKLSVFDLQNFTKKRDYIQDLDGIYTHMDIGAYGDVYAVANQYLPVKGLSSRQIRKRLQETGVSHDFAMSAASADSGKIALTTPVIKVNPKTGAREELIAGDDINLRSQSVAAHTGSKRVFATYTFSNHMVVIDEAAKKVSAIDMFKYGIHAVRGVAAIANSDYIAVADGEKGVAILNASTLEMVQQFSPRVFNSTHVFSI